MTQDCANADQSVAKTNATATAAVTETADIKATTDDEKDPIDVAPTNSLAASNLLLTNSVPKLISDDADLLTTHPNKADAAVPLLPIDDIHMKCGTPIVVPMTTKPQSPPQANGLQHRKVVHSRPQSGTTEHNGISNKTHQVCYKITDLFIY